MTQYRVGQVLYVVLRKESRVVPMQVTEEITKKTLAGVETTYRVVAGNEPANSLMIDQVAGEIFDSPESCERALVDRATRSIHKIVATARAKAGEWYGAISTAASDDDAPPSIESLTAGGGGQHAGQSEDTSMQIKMPDGQIVRARISVPEAIT